MIEKNTRIGALRSRGKFNVDVIRRVDRMNGLSEARLYSKLSKDHFTQAFESLTKYGHLLSSSPNEAVLDIGCGPGDITHDLILPSLNPSFSILVGMDISAVMIDFARGRWSDETRLQFITMDAGETDRDAIEHVLPVKQFNKIFSFYALQWVSNRRIMAQNISNILAPGGQAYLVFVIRSGVYPVWDTLAKCDKWANYFKGVKVPLNEYQYMERPEVEVIQVLEAAGLQMELSKVQCHLNAFASNIESDLEKCAKLRSVDPLVGLLPEHLKEEYMAEVLNYTKMMVGPRGAVDYTSLTIICRKPL